MWASGVVRVLCEPERKASSSVGTDARMVLAACVEPW